MIQNNDDMSVFADYIKSRGGCDLSANYVRSFTGLNVLAGVKAAHEDVNRPKEFHNWCKYTLSLLFNDLPEKLRTQYFGYIADGSTCSYIIVLSVFRRSRKYMTKAEKSMYKKYLKKAELPKAIRKGELD